VIAEKSKSIVNKPLRKLTTYTHNVQWYWQLFGVKHPLLRNILLG
jgi:hypothetical protein